NDQLGRPRVRVYSQIIEEKRRLIFDPRLLDNLAAGLLQLPAQCDENIVDKLRAGSVLKRIDIACAQIGHSRGRLQRFDEAFDQLLERSLEVRLFQTLV